MTRYLPVALAVLAAASPGTAQPAGPDPADTRLLTMPAVGPRHVAFVYADDLWVADLDGKNPRRLTADVGVESSPVFSPDGGTVVFSDFLDDRIEAYRVGAPPRPTGPSPGSARR